jgi:hypothetical protein
MADCGFTAIFLDGRLQRFSKRSIPIFQEFSQQITVRFFIDNNLIYNKKCFTKQIGVPKAK